MFISNCTSCAYFLLLLYAKREKSVISLRPSDFTLESKVVKEVFSVGVPSAIQNFFNVAGVLVLNDLTASYGVDAVSAMGIAKKVDMVSLYIALGFSQGIMPLVSYTYASKNYSRMKGAIILSFKAIMPIQVIGAALYFAAAEPLMRLFIDTDAVVGYGTFFLRALSFSLPFVAFDYVSVGIFQALGDGKGPFVIALSRKGVLDIPLMFALNVVFPLYGIAFSQVIAEGVLSVVELFLLRRVFTSCAEDAAIQDKTARR